MRRVFQLPGTKRRVRAALDDELHFHLEGRIEDLMEREGLSRDDAEREARRRFGDLDTYRREARAIDDNILLRRRNMDVMETLKRETVSAARTLRRSPSFSFIAVVTLALGLGAATTIFTLLDRVVLRPLPYPNADRLAHIGTLWPKLKAGEEYGIARGQYFYFKKRSQSIADIAFYDHNVMTVPGDGDHPAERVPEVDVSASTFAILGIRPQLGRLFTVEEERNPDGDPRVVLLSDGYWRRRFGADKNVIGKRISLGTNSVEIIGVLAPGAGLPGEHPDVWVRNPLDPNARPQNNHTHSAIALLRPGATIEGTLAELKRLQADFMRENPDVYSEAFVDRTGFAMNATSLRDYVVGGTIVRAIWLLFAAVAFVLLVGVLAIPLIKLGGVLDETRHMIKGVSDETVPLLNEVTTTVTPANAQLVRVDAITSNVQSATTNVSALTALVAATVGGPVVKVAAFSYGVRQAMSGRGSKRRKGGR